MTQLWKCEQTICGQLSEFSVITHSCVLTTRISRIFPVPSGSRHAPSYPLSALYSFLTPSMYFTSVKPYEVESCSMYSLCLAYLLCLWNSPILLLIVVYIPLGAFTHLFIHSHIDKHLGSFQFGAFMNSAAKNVMISY